MKTLILIATLFTVSAVCIANESIQCDDMENMPLVLAETSKDQYLIEGVVKLTRGTYFNPGFNYGGIKYKTTVTKKMDASKLNLEIIRFETRFSPVAIDLGHTTGINLQRPGKYGYKTIIKIDFKSGAGSIEEFELAGSLKSKLLQQHKLKNCTNLEK